MGVELPRRSLSPVLVAVVWTLLSSGILLSFCFLLFTVRFKNNRIVKMSSPNLNVLTLCGSVLSYISGFLFTIDERTHPQDGASRAVLQARMWTLCIGSTLVFGPILGKTWRLYRVFTQRVPDKRVIIRDIQLMGMVALLIVVDILVLSAWNLSDPIRCSRSFGAVVKVVERDVSYSLSQLDSCSSVYSDLWLILIAVQKGSLLLYGTYLAGLTSNVSHPPVNQSPTIITAVTLVTVSSAVAVPMTVFLPAWPNLVYSTVGGAIFICTLATNCVLFVPQLTQWRQFEEEHNSPSQMAKYFSSPSKSQPSVYSQDEIYYLLGENNSMKKMLSEKNAVIDSLQEQVNNAKGKLLRLMSASQPRVDQEMDSSGSTNLNSCSTQTTVVVQSSPPPAERDAESRLSSSSRPLSPRTTTNAVPSKPLPEATSPGPISTSPAPTSSSPLPTNGAGGAIQKGAGGSQAGDAEITADESKAKGRGVQPPVSPLSIPAGSKTVGETAPLSPSNCVQTAGGGDLLSALGGSGSGVRQAGFVSSEQLQEVLQELSVDAARETALRSPPSQVVWGGPPRRPSQATFTDPSLLSPLSLRSPCGGRGPPVLFRYPSISPYAMRKRRPPFHSPRGGGPPACFYTGPETPVWGGKRRDISSVPQQQPDNHPPSKTCTSQQKTEGGGVTAADPTSSLQLDNSDIEEEEEEEEEVEQQQQVKRREQRYALRHHKCSCVLPRGPGRGRGGPVSPSSRTETNGEGAGQVHTRHARDSCGYWDSDSDSSSTDYCYYHRPYCEWCLVQRGSLLSSDTSSDSSDSDSEYGDYSMNLYRSPHPVVFKEDLKPTFV